MKRLIKLSFLILLMKDIRATTPKKVSGNNNTTELSKAEQIELDREIRETMQKDLVYSKITTNMDDVDRALASLSVAERIALRDIEREDELSDNIRAEIINIIQGEADVVGNNREKRRNERKSDLVSFCRKADSEKMKEHSQQRQKERERELLYWKDIRAKRLAREVKGRGNSNSNHRLARVNKELGLARKQVRPVRKQKQKQEYAPKQERKPVLSEEEIENILYEDDLDTFKKVGRINRGITKDEMLRQACVYGATKIILLLIKEGANAKSRDKGGNTPLHYAVIAQKVKVAKLLIDTGANVNHKNCLGWTPLYYVLGTGDVSLAKLLIDARANISSKDKNNNTVLEAGLWMNCSVFSSSKDNEKRLKVMNYIKSVVKRKNRLL